MLEYNQNNFRKYSQKSLLTQLYPYLISLIIGDKNTDKDDDFDCRWECMSWILTVLSGYIKTDPSQFILMKDKNNKSYYDLTLTMIRQVRINSVKYQYESDDVIKSVKLLITMVESLKGKIDDQMPYLIDMLFDYFRAKDEKLNVDLVILQAIGMCIWYNPILVLSIMNQKNHLETYLVLQESYLNDFKNVFDIRRAIFGVIQAIKIDISPNIKLRFLKICIKLAFQSQTIRVKSLKSQDEEMSEQLEKMSRGEYNFSDGDEDIIIDQDDKDVQDFISRISGFNEEDKEIILNQKEKNKNFIVSQLGQKGVR
ncbi:UNKNOWN [Stylonychia lemnae]|uniref:Uncharacterized protein n=1 Tax=Stylonychia lemnae TaxID=5949 RepID=A0A078AMM5_STYLE|nr:UNKNOWN [Stylonychia lemnae]|eukprot:CDW83650.1 UNKNOWN [Stylonychia lemnae]